jgi:hypothetical protein
MKLSEVNTIANSAIIKRSVFWDFTTCSPLKSVDVSEEQVASIFRTEE